MRTNKKVKWDKVQDKMTDDDTIPGFSITVETTEEHTGTYVYEDEDKTKLKIDPSDRLDLVYKFDKILSHLRTYHTGTKSACTDCNTEFIVSGASNNKHEVDGITCPECDSSDIINLDLGDDI